MIEHGHYEPAFRPLAETFFRATRDAEGGGALAVYQDGVKVLDVWGGLRDPSGAPWLERTPSLSFSTTKGVASVALHMCADRGLIDYDVPVARYWPEFEQAGKGAITVRHVLCHEAGLYDVRGLLSDAHDLLDWDRVVTALAAASPAHPAGRHNAYHALTYGYLVGELVRRVSGAHLRDFVRTELAEPLGLDHLHIGAPPEAIAEAARYFPLPAGELSRHRPRRSEGAAPRRAGDSPGGSGTTTGDTGSRHGRRGWRSQLQTAGVSVLRRAGVPLDQDRFVRALAPRGVAALDWSADATLAACNPSAGGLFTARALAKLYGALAVGGTLDGVRVLSPERIEQLVQLQNRRLDGVLLLPMHWRLGFHSIASKRGFHPGAFGHYGFRGSGAFADPRRRLGVAYVTNCGAGSPIGDGRIFEFAGVAARCAKR
ncbi:MAG: beta-lactamase family protein [Myxococcales bacterium]|nr:beta-lactamase family protein [Myxococcales bacterium]MCB9630181.1 beta-lactamase family protein [Sandaracinaceae bacterium]